MSSTTLSDEALMDLALAQAQDAATLGEVPVGAVVSLHGEIIVTAHNLRETERDPTAHAELLAIRAAANKLGRWRLSGCTLTVTLEPCAMCAGAIVNARVDRLVFGARDPRAGAAGSVFEVLGEPRLNHRPEVISGVRSEQAAALLKNFFAARR